MTTAEMVLFICVMIMAALNIFMHSIIKEEKEKKDYFYETCCKFMLENAKLKKQLTEETADKKED